MENDEFLQEKDPMNWLNQWLEESQTMDLRERNAMTLATVSVEGEVSTRIVLYKEITATGLIFYTNYNENKVRDSSDNPPPI